MTLGAWAVLGMAAGTAEVRRGPAAPPARSPCRRPPTSQPGEAAGGCFKPRSRRPPASSASRCAPPTRRSWARSGSSSQRRLSPGAGRRRLLRDQADRAPVRAGRGVSRPASSSSGMTQTTYIFTACRGGAGVLPARFHRRQPQESAAASRSSWACPMRST